MTKEQRILLPLVSAFKKDFFLVGGTAIALHLGHRRSIDFDLFSRKSFDNTKIRSKVSRYGKIQQTYINQEGEFTCLVAGVKCTFFHFDYDIKTPFKFEANVHLPNLLTLGAMKAFALGHRSKWKDYVDLYFLLKDHFTVEEISKKAKVLFGGEFNQRIFREALGYFDDINYSEKVIFMPGYEVSDAVIKKELITLSVQ